MTGDDYDYEVAMGARDEPATELQEARRLLDDARCEVERLRAEVERLRRALAACLPSPT